MGAFDTLVHHVEREAGDRLAQRAQKWLLERVGDSMQIESLWKYNAKFDPDWHPRYAVYDSLESFLPAALAVAKRHNDIKGTFLAAVLLTRLDLGLLILLSLFHYYTAGFGLLQEITHRGVHLAFVLGLIFLDRKSVV